MRKESVHDLVEEIIRTARMRPEMAETYRRRVQKALWRDRAELIELMPRTRPGPGRGSKTEEES